MREWRGDERLGRSPRWETRQARSRWRQRPARWPPRRRRRTIRPPNQGAPPAEPWAPRPGRGTDHRRGSRGKTRLPRSWVGPPPMDPPRRHWVLPWRPREAAYRRDEAENQGPLPDRTSPRRRAPRAPRTESSRAARPGRSRGASSRPRHGRARRVTPLCSASLARHFRRRRRHLPALEEETTRSGARRPSRSCERRRETREGQWTMDAPGRTASTWHQSWIRRSPAEVPTAALRRENHQHHRARSGAPRERAPWRRSRHDEDCTPELQWLRCHARAFGARRVMLCWLIVERERYVSSRRSQAIVCYT